MNRISAVVLLVLLAFSVNAQKSGRPSQPDIPGDILLDFGINMWSEDTQLLRQDIWKSNSFSVYYSKRYPMGEHFSFNVGAGLGIEKYAFNDSYTWRSDNTGMITLDTLSEIHLTKNKLAVTYFDIPAELRYYPLGTVHGEGLFVGLGVLGGLRIDTHTKVKYDISESTIKEKLHARLGVNDFRYGVQARFGVRSIHVFYKYYFSNVFSSSPDASGINPTSSTFGINFSGF